MEILTLLREKLLLIFAIQKLPAARRVILIVGPLGIPL